MVGDSVMYLVLSACDDSISIANLITIVTPCTSPQCGLRRPGVDGRVQPRLWKTALDEAVDILVLFFMACGELFSFCTREVSDLPESTPKAVAAGDRGQRKHKNVEETGTKTYRIVLEKWPSSPVNLRACLGLAHLGSS